MTISVHEVDPRRYQALFPLLLLAEPSESALQWSLANLSDTVYEVRSGGQVIGATSVRWQDEAPEIVELAVAAEHQGRGVGRQIVAWLINEARRRGKKQLLVGTANSSIGNIIFYQRCGFRMDHVRKDYFWYYREPIIENGIRGRDMLVFRYEIAESEDESKNSEEWGVKKKWGVGSGEWGVQKTRGVAFPSSLDPCAKEVASAEEVGSGE